MKKVYFLFPICILALLVSCRNDDDNPNFVPARDRGEEAPASTAIIEDYLSTHFYNYEEFENPPADFDYRIKFDTIAGDNSDKTPLIDQVDSKMVPDRLAEGVEYKLYYLVVEEGGGERPDFPDVSTITYDGIWINDEENVAADYTGLLDSSVTPISFSMTSIVNGLQDALVEFRAAEEIIDNDDGSLTPVNPGIGAVFMQSGLAYYVNETGAGGNIPVYAQLIFSFQLYQVGVGDQDNDGVPSVMEDLNGNELEEDDDTDGDGLPNWFDADDDNDGRPTSQEIEVDEDGNITFPDVDNDGTPDYLDSDS